ncbi:hypothetical protein EV421DRAFT_2039435 [Armillaria borealis]|uniref:Secreted protein n=1 Tax=Armillaria borealis TaxID=47425 RepID=A0AA39MIK3_9AGAR|nr:hypothetical protein EV421DRAFT_2039435 [Armillaria borealis]
MLFSFFLFSLLAFVCGAPASSAVDAGRPSRPALCPVSAVTLTLDGSLRSSLVVHCHRTPLIVEITLDRVAVSAGIGGVEYISFDHTFEDPVVVPILGTADSGVIENVALTQGGLTTLNIVPDGFLNLLNLDLYLREATIGGSLGYPCE